MTISEEGRAELPGLYVPNVRADATSKSRASWAVCSTRAGGEGRAAWAIRSSCEGGRHQ